MTDVAITSRREKLRSVIGNKADIEFMDGRVPCKNAVLLDVGQHAIFVRVGGNIGRIEFVDIRSVTYRKEETIRGPFGQEGQE